MHFSVKKIIPMYPGKKGKSQKKNTLKKNHQLCRKVLSFFKKEICKTFERFSKKPLTFMTQYPRLLSTNCLVIRILKDLLPSKSLKAFSNTIEEACYFCERNSNWNSSKIPQQFNYSRAMTKYWLEKLKNTKDEIQSTGK